MIGIKKHLGNGTLERLSGRPADLASVLGTVAVTLVSNLIMHWRKAAFYPYRFGFWLTNGMALWFISEALDIFKLVSNYAGATILGFYAVFYLIVIFALGNRQRLPHGKMN